MKQFMGEDFLLDSEPARKLYYDYAKNQPIIDWHCHLPPKEIQQDRRFSSIAAAWLEADHYKWRAMRLCGIDERYITGPASEREKFDKWAGALPRMVGNPLYHWTHLELQRCFGIGTPLSEKTAAEIWEQAGERLREESFSARGLIRRFHVKAVFTTDDPADSLAYHKLLREDKSFSAKVLPAFRPDKVLGVADASYPGYIAALATADGGKIGDLDELEAALSRRMDFFGAMGCRAADQAFPVFPFAECGREEAAAIFSAALKGEAPDAARTEQFRTYLLRHLAEGYRRRGWAMELHIGPMRNNNTGMYRSIGPDTGFDSMNDAPVAQKLSRFLDSLEKEGRLPKTVLFALNPKDSIVLGTMLGNFAAETDGKLQLGTAWWFNDNIDGMTSQIRTLANVGVLANFIGMVTDSRSFLSYPRHEYFRRILCNILGGWVENGEYPPDYDTLGGIVEGICYKNAAKYFSLE